MNNNISKSPPGFDWVRDALHEIDTAGQRRMRPTVLVQPAGKCIVADQQLLNFSSNDYLGLSQHPRILRAFRECLETSASGSTASPLVAGRSPWHAQLEHRLAEFENVERAVLFPSGFAANVSSISALVTEEDVVFCDLANHASLVDGCRLSGSKLVTFRHNRLESLRTRIQRYPGRRRYLVTDSVFSMDGDIAPLDDIAAICAESGIGLIVDEAHATGVFGEHGRGACEEFGVEALAGIRIGTLSKAVGLVGGFAVGDEELMDYLWHRARGQVYSTALPPAVCAAACVAIDVMQSETWRRQRLLENATLVRTAIQDLPVTQPVCSTSPIIPIVLSHEASALAAARDLANLGCFVPAIRPPTVPRGTSRLRISVSAAHAPEDIQHLIHALESVLSRPHNG